MMVLYRDMRTYGFREAAYREAREKGVLFVRYEPEQPPKVSMNGSGAYPAADCWSRFASRPSAGSWSCEPDLVVLAAPMIPRADRAELSELLRVPLNADGFFLEAHMKLRPVDFASEGLVPLRHGPRAEVRERDDRPGQRRSGPGGVDPLQEENARRRPDGLGRSGQVHLLHDLRPRLPVHGPAGEREQQG